MAKLADALYSGCSIRKDVQVQVLFRARYVQTRTMRVFSLMFPIIFLLIHSSTLIAQSQDFRSSFQKGRDAMKQSLYPEAIIHFEDWTKAVPRDASALALLASSYARVGNVHSALSALERIALIGLDEIYLIEGDTILRALVLQHAQKIQASSPIFTGKDNPWTSLLHSLHQSSKANRFPFAFAEQRRIGRYRILYPKQYDSTVKHKLILLLHGNGLDPAYMLDWAQTFGFTSHIIIAPEAPYLKFGESLHAGMMKFSGRGEDQGFPDSLDAEVINQSSAWYHAIVDHARATLPILDEPAIVMGFSQGGFFSTVLLTRYPEIFSTAITLCGSQYPSGKVIENLKKVKENNRDILIVHGKEDATVSITIAEGLARSLKEAGVSHHFLSFEGGHWPADAVVGDIKEWILSH